MSVELSSTRAVPTAGGTAAPDGATRTAPRPTLRPVAAACSTVTTPRQPALTQPEEAAQPTGQLQPADTQALAHLTAIGSPAAPPTPSSDNPAAPATSSPAATPAPTGPSTATPGPATASAAPTLTSQEAAWDAERTRDMVQLLSPDGTRRHSPAWDPFTAPITDDLLRRAYREMTLTRAFDTQATALQRQGELGLWVQSLGQEAAQVGSALALEDRDYIFPSYRDHGVLQVRGIPLPDTLPLFRGCDHGAWDTRRYNTHLYTLVIGSQTLHAAGYAMGVALDGASASGNAGTDEAVIVYLGDGATSQGDVSEALNLAAVTRAPLVFFIQNNGWAISEPNVRQAAAPLYKRGEGFGIPGVRVDGNDVLACFAATRWATDRARAGLGPSVIEAVTYRMGAHTTSDDPTRYRSRAEEQRWATRDPLTRLRTYLESVGTPASFFDALVPDADALAALTRQACLAIAEPHMEDLFAKVYATDNPLVDTELARYRSGSAITLTSGSAHGTRPQRQAQPADRPPAAASGTGTRQVSEAGAAR